MFHPTVFENIKVALENQLYDLDNLDSRIEITDRTDTLDLARMSRTFTLSFRAAGSHRVVSEVILRAGLRDLADEILEVPEAQPGCRLQLRFHLGIAEPETQCPRIAAELGREWGPEPQPVLRLSYVFGAAGETLQVSAELDFRRTITEEQMEDLPDLLEHVLRSAEALESV